MEGTCVLLDPVVFTLTVTGTGAVEIVKLFLSKLQVESTGRPAQDIEIVPENPGPPATCIWNCMMPPALTGAGAGPDPEYVKELDADKVRELVENMIPTPRPQRGARPPGPPARDTWHAEPVKVFDNLYFLGQTEFSSWAVTTSAGIIIIDSIFDYSVDDEVVGGIDYACADQIDGHCMKVSDGEYVGRGS